MQEFEIRVNSVQDVLDFVSLATARDFPVMVGNENHLVNGKSFMEMFCLNCHSPLKVTARCSEEEFRCLVEEADRFLVK